VENVEFDEVEQVLVARPAEAARDQTLRAVRASVPCYDRAGGEGGIWARSRSGWRPTRPWPWGPIITWADAE
jgi:hypothetical protein